jgi:hypothetical protein
VKFNWVISGENDQAVKKACIDMEYRLRPKIMKFLLSKLGGDFSGDFSCFHFDVDLKNRWVWISDKTPRNLIEKIRVDFDREINGGSTLFSVA